LRPVRAFNDLDFLVGEAVKFVNQFVNLRIGRFDFGFERGEIGNAGFRSNSFEK